MHLPVPSEHQIVDSLNRLPAGALRAFRAGPGRAVGCRTLSGLLALLLLPAVLQAQSRTTASLRGTVSATDGEPLQGAVVTMIHQPSGEERSTITDGQGRFLVLLLRPGGPYTLTIRYLGFAEREVTGLELQVGDARTLDLTLTEQAVQIDGVAVAVDRADIFDASQVGPATRLSERMIAAMPVLSRNVLELTQLSPLVRTTEGGGFSIAGQNDRYNAILVDGLLSKDMFGLTSGGIPGGQAGAKLIPIDAVSQYEILVAPFDVRLSGFSGGVMNAITRSGTNEWRGQIGGVHRNQALIGDLSLPTGSVDASVVDRSLLAFTLGGPLVQNRAHIFAAGEFEVSRQPPDGFNVFRDAPTLTRLTAADVTEVSDIMRDQYGVDVGEIGAYPLETTLANTFLRADFQLGARDRLTVRHILAHAESDEAPEREPFLPYGLGSNAVRRRSTNQLIAAQLFKEFDGGLANELDLTIQLTTDGSSPTSDLPQIEVELPSTIEGQPFSRAVRLGGQYFAQSNRLEQTSIRLTNSLDIPVDDEVLTLGVSGSWYGFKNAFLPGAAGEFYFGSIEDLRQNAPFRYQRSQLAPGEEDAVRFDVAEFGIFAQREIRAGDGLTMHFGFRADIPFVLDAPARNFDLEAFFGYNSSKVPSGNFLFSPRWGFNWQSEGERKTQVRGGAGMFTGQIPYVWLSNAFHDNGLRSQNLYCQDRRYFMPPLTSVAPPFDPLQPPDSCTVSGPGVQRFGSVRNAVVFDPAFRYPQDIKMSAVIDRELSDRTTGSLGVLFNRALNQVGLMDLNVEPGIPGSRGPDFLGQPLVALAGDQRRYYRQIGDEYQHILAVTNEGDNWAVALTAELRGALTETVAFQLGYSYARTWDRTSLVYTDMVSNFGTNPAVADINDPPLTTSNFDRPHKLLLAVFGAPIRALPRTELSLFYSGQSGYPFTYVYRGDINGDGYPGRGGSADRFNDPLFVPEIFPVAPLSNVAYFAVIEALERDSCFGSERGRTLGRNECRAPWEHKLDMRLAQSFDMGSSVVRVEADLLNLLSLINAEWGRVEKTRPQVPLIELCELECNGFVAPFPGRWAGPLVPDADAVGGLAPIDPWTVVTPESQWRIQVGAKVTFGGATER